MTIDGDPPPDAPPRRRPVGPGRGDTMQLPAADIVASLEAQDGGPGRVLVCEPNPEAAEALTAPLRGRGLTVEVVPDPEALVEAAVRLRPHAVFVAFDRAPERARAALRRLRAMTVARDWLLVATGDTTDNGVAALAAGCDLAFTRPVSADQLDDVLARCIAADDR
jgi:two-component system OmpR family response regulator